MVLKELILTVFTLGWCGGLERTDVNSFYFCRCVLALKKLIFYSFHFGEGVVLL